MSDKQARIDSDRDIVVGVNKYQFDGDNSDDGDINGDGNEGVEDASDALRIDNAAVRESHIRRPGELRANRDKNEVREALDRLKRIAALSEDDDNDDNVINNSKHEKR